MNHSPVIGLVFLTCLSSDATAFFDPPYIVPASPTVGQQVFVEIHGGYCDTIIGSPGYPQITREGNSIRMLFFSAHEDLIEWCIYGEGTASEPVGSFPAGSYTLQVDRNYQTFFGDVTETLGVVPFTGRGPRQQLRCRAP